MNPAESPDRPSVIVPQYAARELAADIATTFPELRSVLDSSEHYLISLLGAELLRAQQQDIARAWGILRFLQAVLARSDLSSEITNAMAISFPRRSEVSSLPGGAELVASGLEIWPG